MSVKKIAKVRDQFELLCLVTIFCLSIMAVSPTI